MKECKGECGVVFWVLIFESRTKVLVGFYTLHLSNGYAFTSMLIRNPWIEDKAAVSESCSHPPW